MIEPEDLVTNFTSHEWETFSDHHLSQTINTPGPTQAPQAIAAVSDSRGKLCVSIKDYPITSGKAID